MTYLEGMDPDPWVVLACVNGSCQVSTFDRGNDARCPACNAMGEEVSRW